MFLALRVDPGVRCHGGYQLNRILLWAVIACLVGVFVVGPIAERNVPEPCTCGGEPTKISAIQGAGPRSPLIGETVTVSAVVVAEYAGGDGLDDYFLQEEDRDADSDPDTSEGIFVYDPDGSLDVEVGELVCVTGKVAEYKGLTELREISQVRECGREALPSPIEVRLPIPEGGWLERVEGMRVRFPQELTVTDTYGLGRYGEVTLSNGRLYCPTEVAAPGAEAEACMASNVLNRIVLDDGSSRQNPDPILYPSPGLSATNTLRDGYTVRGLEGVLTTISDTYMIEPTVDPEFIAANPRPPAPPDLDGRLKVASFNVENYFNGDGDGSGFPTGRGAATHADFERQEAKLVAALIGLDADVIGLAEIENDGFGPGSAIAQLVSGMNAAAPSGTSYAYVDPGVDRLGTDQIKVAIVYRIESVEPVGDPAVLPADELPEMNRPPLAQTFAERSSGAEFTVLVAHLKSKSPSRAHGPDRDQGDGQGCWNRNRTEAAEAILCWIETDPTGSGDPDVLIVGDLNAYPNEDPIATIQDASYTDLIDYYSGDESYTYVYMGEAGRLDHAFASASLTDQVTGAGVWHINADEPPVLGYESAYKSKGQIDSLYRDDPYRSSDHDPILVGLELN